jgi:glyoxylase-like metal-dependent hydrolase (beta-lactamase superfamily II)
MRRLSAFGLALALGLQPSAASGGSSGELPRPQDGYDQRLSRVAPRVWVLAQPRFLVQPAGNVTIIEQSDGFVLVDGGGSPGAARRVVGHVRRLGRKPVKAVVITHWHGDHPQGLAEIQAAWPQARTIATAATQGHLRNPKTMNTPARPDPAADAAFRRRADQFVAFAQRMAGEASDPRMRAGWETSARLFRQYGRDMEGALTLAPAEAFTDRLALPDPLAPVELRFLGRANTDGDAVVWLPRQRVLVTGDILVEPLPFGFGGYPSEWLQVLEKLRAYRFSVLVPGHGAPQRDRAYLDRVAAALAEVRRKVAALAAEGRSLEEVQARIDLSAQAAAFAGDDPWLRRWFAEYWVRPIVTSAFREAQGEPIVQSLGG